MVMGIPKSGTPAPPEGYELITKGFWEPGDKYLRLDVASKEWRNAEAEDDRSVPIKRNYLCARPIANVQAEQWEQVARSLDSIGIKPTTLEELKSVDFNKIPQGRVMEVIKEHGCETLGELKRKINQVGKTKQWGTW